MKASAGITLVIFGALLIAGFVLAEHHAEAKAKAFCSRFTLGGDFNHAIEAVNASGTAHGAYERSGKKTAYVSYMGGHPFSQHICFIDGAGGKIIRLRYESYHPD
jgi:hypothetical protein